ncbi:MAG: hypothetical protein EOP42_34010 [Sphingobacteriaceae bacterium]|nr:MAG: hypothetical protein EOP42_34010 [Sphingobacteriaceae bacterium]
MEMIIVYPKNAGQMAAFKAVAKALQIDFEVEKSSYGPEFVAKIKRGEKAAKEGKGIRVDVLKTFFDKL